MSSESIEEVERQIEAWRRERDRADPGWRDRLIEPFSLEALARMEEPTMEVRWPGWSLGSIIALLVFILAVVFWATGKMNPVEAGLFMGLAAARLT